MGTEIAVVKMDEFAVLVPGSEQAEIMAMNLGGDKLSSKDIDTVKVPSAGGTFWQVPTAGGEKAVQHLDGIIVYFGGRRNLWESSEPGKGEQPLCSSRDMIHGQGPLDKETKKRGPGLGVGPDSLCDGCEHNAFGTAIKQDGSQGRGKRCKESCTIGLLLTGSTLPVRVTIPAASLGLFSTYRRRLPCLFYLAVTRLTLKAERNADKILYSSVVFEQVGQLPDSAETKIAARKFVETFRSVFAQDDSVVERESKEEGEQGEKA